MAKKKTKKAKKKSNEQTPYIKLVVLLLILTLGYLFINSEIDHETNLQEDGENTIKKFTTESSTVGLVIGDELADDKVQTIETMDYDELKKKLQLSSDFCIYLEDETGNHVPLHQNDGIGSDSIKVNGKPCK